MPLLGFPLPSLGAPSALPLVVPPPSLCRPPCPLPPCRHCRSLPWEDEVVIGGLERDVAADRQLTHLGPLATSQYIRNTVYFDSHGVR